LGSLGYTSVLIESGQKLFHNLLMAKLVDEIWWFKSAEEIGQKGLDLMFNQQDLAKFDFSLSGTYPLSCDRLSIFLRH